MCVKIIKSDCEVAYNPNEPLELQIANSKEVIVNYEPFDKSIDRFLEEVKRFANTGHEIVTIKVIHNDHLFGAKMRQKFRKALNDIKVNEIIKVMVLSHAEVDQRLEQLANSFKGVCK